MCNANYSGCALGAPRRSEAEEQPGAPRAKVLATRPELGGGVCRRRGLRVEAVDRGVLLGPNLARGVARALGLDRHVRHGVLADEAEHGGVGERGAVGAEKREQSDSDGAFHGAFSFKKSQRVDASMTRLATLRVAGSAICRVSRACMATITGRGRAWMFRPRAST